MPITTNHNQETGKPEDAVPQSTVEAIQEGNYHIFGQSLLDTGGSRSLIACLKIPKKGIKFNSLATPYSSLSAGGLKTLIQSIVFNA